MMVLKTRLYCQSCNIEVIRKDNETWKEVLNREGWKWCHAPNDSTKMFCKKCTLIFEKTYNVVNGIGQRKRIWYKPIKKR